MTIDDLLRMRLSRNQRLRGFAFCLLIFTGIEGYYLAFPRWTEYQDAQNILSSLENKRPSQKYQASDVAARLQEVNRINAEATLQRDRFPVAESVSTMLIELERMTKDHKVQIRSFMPTRLLPFDASASLGVPLPTASAPPATPSVSPKSGLTLLEQVVELEASGNFVDLLSLLRSLERFRYPLGIKKLDLAPPEGKTASGSVPVDQLGLKLVFSAFLLDKNPNLPMVDPLAQRWLPQAQLHAGQPNPFKGLTPPASPLPALAAIEIPAMPVPATPDPIEAWRLDGVFQGPGKTAIVSDGKDSRTVSPGDLLEEWKVWSIDENGLILLREGKRKRLSFPSLRLPPGSQVSD